MRTLRSLCAVLATLLLAATAAAQEVLMLPLEIDGERVRLEVRVFKPEGTGPFPTVIFHHGSTGSGRDPSIFTQHFKPAGFGQYFLSKGWALVMPFRRGRGSSEGLYDEGFSVDRRRGYTCDPPVSLAGADRALRDIDALTLAIVELPFIDRSRLVLAGQSRGGILSIAYAAKRPELFKGVINFVGGWLGTGCGETTTERVNQDLFRRGSPSPLPSLWLYGAHDPYYPLDHSRGNFAAFEAAGGKGEFITYPKPDDMSGHAIYTRAQHLGAGRHALP
jgi:dienelactone hydrolase